MNKSSKFCFVVFFLCFCLDNMNTSRFSKLTIKSKSCPWTAYFVSAWWIIFRITFAAEDIFQHSFICSKLWPSILTNRHILKFHSIDQSCVIEKFLKKIFQFFYCFWGQCAFYESLCKNKQVIFLKTLPNHIWTVKKLTAAWKNTLPICSSLNRSNKIFVVCNIIYNKTQIKFYSLKIHFS